MKRRFLLFFALFLMAVVVNAAPVAWSDDDGNSVEYDILGDHVRIAVSNAGALAAFFNSTAANDVFGSTPTLLKIETKGEDGALNADDLAALNSSTHAGLAHFTKLNMGKATLEEGASVKVMSLSGAEYMALPHGTPIADMKALGTNCTSLKAVAATDADDPTEFTGYSWAAGEIWNICQLEPGLIEGIRKGICANTMQKLTIGGYVNDRDASTIAQTQYNTNETSYGTQTAKYFLNGEQVDCAQDYIVPTNSNNGNGCSPWVGSTEISLDFTEAIFANKGDLALVSPNVTELLLPTESSFTEIKPFMFANLKKLRHIIVPNNIVTIGDGAFYVNDATSVVEEITIGNGIKTIGNAAFAAPTGQGSARANLTDIRFASGISDVKILACVFNGCNSIKHMVLPEGIVSLGERCFNQLLELESVHFPSTLEYIGRDCFRQTGLTMLTIPKSVKVIDYNAFSLCRITDIYLMAESVSQLPYIYAMDYNYTTSTGDGTISTFDSNMLNGNNTTAPVSQKNDFLEKDSRGGEELFRLSVSDGNTITKLHFTENLKNYIDFNPWYFEGQTTPKPNSDALYGEGGNGGINEAKHLSDTYYLKDNENTTYPAADAWDLARPTWAAYYSSESHAWDANGSNTDYTKEAGTQAPYYDPATGVLSTVTEDTDHILGVLRKEGWRQFTFKSGDAGSEDIVFNKQYENVWYTMCFPFSLTDEQLETAFNAEYNIADFSGVEIVSQDESGNPLENKSLIIHFNKIAKAKYFDLDHNEYQRVEGSKVQKVAKNGAIFNTYTYTRDGQEYKYVETYSNKSYAKDGNKENGIVYIDGYLSQAGHPYMIHPNLGTQQGDPAVTAHMVGINYYSKDASVIAQLCRDEARSVDLGTTGGYKGVTMTEDDASDIAVLTDNAMTENFDQKAYNGYAGQTYSFVGNCNEYKDGAPAMPSYANGGLTALPNIEDYVDAKYLPNGPVKAEQGEEPNKQDVIDAVGERMTEAPTFVNNPDEDEETYSSAFKTLFNAVRCENVYLGYIDGENRYADFTYGEDLIAYEFSDFFNNYNGYSYATRSTGHNSECKYTELETYLGAASQADITDRFAALKQLAQNYVAAKSAHAQYQIDLETYNANVAAWAEYDQAVADYNNYSDEAAEAAFQAALAEYTTQLGDYNEEYQRVQSANAAAIEAWRQSASSYAVLIPTNAYFLSRKTSEYYTHFFREVAPMSGRAAGHGMWSRYTAVLIPNAAAIAGIEAGVEPDTASGAKAVEPVFDEEYSQFYETTEIESILEEAREQGKSIEYMDVVISIDGKVVRRGDTSLEGLPRGLYIVNGKKYFVK